MFETFTSGARDVVRRAAAGALRRGDGVIGEEQLLLALLDDPGSVSGRVLAEFGVTASTAPAIEAAFDRTRRRGGLSEDDVAALGDLGVDVDAIVRTVEGRWGTGALAGGPRRRPWRPRRRAAFDGAAKATLGSALREARERGDRHLGDEHLLLALLSRHGPVGEVLATHGVTAALVRSRLAAVRAP